MQIHIAAIIYYLIFSVKSSPRGKISWGSGRIFVPAVFALPSLPDLLRLTLWLHLWKGWHFAKNMVYCSLTQKKRGKKAAAARPSMQAGGATPVKDGNAAGGRVATAELSRQVYGFLRNRIFAFHSLFD